MNYKDIIIVIPAYNPNMRLLEVVRSVQAKGFDKIIVIDDGSDNKEVFYSLNEEKIIFLQHAVNQGKGRALKTAFNYILLNLSDAKYVLMVDADGQHSISSICACANEIISRVRGERILLGCRNFHNAVDLDGNRVKIPFRSRIGNRITVKILKYLCGLDVSDSQTGLRGIPVELLCKLLQVEGERYEYEMNMLLMCKEYDISLDEVEIETVYELHNSTSHFSPLKDSWRIYRKIVMYSFSALSSVLVDYIVFIMLASGLGIWKATYGARICSSILNFILNKKMVFKIKGDVVKQILQYACLCIISASLSAFGVSILSDFFRMNVVVCKVIVDTLIYFMNYYIQNNWIFRRRRHGKCT